MPNLDAPARLAFRPEFPWDQGSDFETLRQALTEAAQRPTETPWIVTLSGKILKPHEIRELTRVLSLSPEPVPVRPNTGAQRSSELFAPGPVLAESLDCSWCGAPPSGGQHVFL